MAKKMIITSPLLIASCNLRKIQNN